MSRGFVVTGKGPYSVRLYANGELFGVETFGTVEEAVSRVADFCRLLPNASKIQALRRALKFDHVVTFDPDGTCPVRKP